MKSTEKLTTPIDWFVEELQEHLRSIGVEINLKNTDAYEMAKELFKNDIAYAHQEGFTDAYHVLGNKRTGLEYFNQTYKQ